ncbi:hypothetical protein PsYK624_115800 [Phanerochaete sordida]|uniref:DUF6535 domain-containing protein n=1 Tax=Phanerochaete sordida TaxID=48140 RepID=A0A9P3LHC4_9APHY|nr:hypothetical protein PsYK624_115800 [Phanerochaete sordida]
MRQSLAQNYTFVDGVLRPVTPFPADSSFEAPLWALRVNGLWFASLIVSLSTASFGMLVKQWLNEYLAMEWIEPEAQLRARHFRYTGLKDWRVFEIAAMLPLLLHVSLGLFFLGLCFYTAAANEVVGRSTFPLVAGWAFFALMSVVAPLASPRCPYKVTLLKAALRAGRRCIGSRLRWLAREIYSSALSASGWVWTRVIVRWHDRFVRHVNQTVLARLKTAVYLLLMLLFLVPAAWTMLCVILLVMIPCDETCVEEDADVLGPRKTHEVLLSIDELIGHDGPILETMAAVLRQTKAPPASVTAFILGCIRHRIGDVDTAGRVRGVIDLGDLSPNAAELFLGMAGEMIEEKLFEDEQYSVDDDHDAQSPDLWMANATALLLADCPWRLPLHVERLLSDPTAVAAMLHASRDLLKTWSWRDINRFLGAALALPSGSRASEKNQIWDDLPKISGRVLSGIQEATLLILLENAWRKVDSVRKVRYSGDAVPWQRRRSGAVAAEAARLSIAEATMMLLFMLDAPPPSFSEVEGEQALSGACYGRRHIDHVHNAADILDKAPLDIATPLALVVRSSPDVVWHALNLYRVFFTNSLFDFRPLWKVLMDLPDGDLHSVHLQPSLRDLWAFLLECARLEDMPGYLCPLHVTRDYIKLCVVLSGRADSDALGGPVNGGDILASVLEQADQFQSDLEDDPSAKTVQETIPGLAQEALQRLDTYDRGTLEELRVKAALGRLASWPTPSQDLIPEWLRYVFRDRYRPTRTPPSEYELYSIPNSSSDRGTEHKGSVDSVSEMQTRPSSPTTSVRPLYRSSTTLGNRNTEPLPPPQFFPSTAPVSFWAVPITARPLYEEDSPTHWEGFYAPSPSPPSYPADGSLEHEPSSPSTPRASPGFFTVAADNLPAGNLPPDLVAYLSRAEPWASEQQTPGPLGSSRQLRRDEEPSPEPIAGTNPSSGSRDSH